jgi:L-ascorbate metabolism protein UlaG (beta-lactamase superfamily)
MKARLAAVLPIALATGVALHTGWLEGERPWEEATGWSTIPLELRPAPGLPWPEGAGEAPSIRWLGHSGFLLEWYGRRILLDPNTSARVTIVRRVLERPVIADALGAVDVALVSHAHPDHLDLPTLHAIPHLGAVVIPRGSETYLSDLAGVRVVGLGLGERFRLGAIDIVAVPAAHNGNRFHPFPSARSAVGYVIRHGEAAIYFAGDTGAQNDFAAIGATYHPIVAILPIGAYEPAFPIGRYHLRPEQAVAAAERLGARVVVPCHFGTFALALDRPSAALPRFARAARAHGVRWVMPRLLQRQDVPRDEITVRTSWGAS